MHIHIDIGASNVLIIGKPAAGKTYLSKLLAIDNPGHKLIHTDDYIRYGYKESLYRLLMELGGTSKLTIIEGVLGYRLLRKGVELDCYYPDIVIEIDIPDNLMYSTYRKQRPTKDESYLKGFNSSHSKILNDYKAMLNKKPPQWHKLNNYYEI